MGMATSYAVRSLETFFQSFLPCFHSGPDTTICTSLLRLLRYCMHSALGSQVTTDAKQENRSMVRRSKLPQVALGETWTSLWLSHRDKLKWTGVHSPTGILPCARYLQNSDMGTVHIPTVACPLLPSLRQALGANALMAFAGKNKSF